MQVFCVQSALQFFTEKEDLWLGSYWIRDGKIKIDGEDIDCELTNKHKYTIIKHFCASKDFDELEKEDLVRVCF